MNTLSDIEQHVLNASCDDYEAPHTIAFGKNADDRPVLHDDQKTDVLVGHELHCRKRGVPGTDSPQSLGFGGKDLFKWPVGKDLFGTSKRMVHDASPVRLYEHGLHAEAVKRKAQRGLIYVKPVAVRLLCAATEPGRSSAKNALQGRMAGGRIDLLATLFSGRYVWEARPHKAVPPPILKA